MDTLSTVSILKYSERELLGLLLAQAADRHQPVALWRLPGTELTQLIISENYSALEREQFIEDLDSGFLIAPFEKSKDRYFLKADHFFTFENGKLKAPSNPSEEASTQWLNEQLSTNPKVNFKAPRTSLSPSPPLSKDLFLDIIARGVAEIEKGTFEKIVPSRTRAITLPDKFDVIESFRKLRAAYPQALISFVSIPGVGTWMGESPELLVCVQNKSVFKTVSLAGTLPHAEGTDIRSVAWTQKEIEEQALVERYVISCFKRVRLREYEEYGPKTMVAGNVMHLKSEFTVDIKATNFPQIGSVMLDLLHPTSAVCGMPLEPALEFLRSHEQHDRRFYAGYLGPVNVYNNIDLFVNLRCMEMSGNQAILYAGAGVTIDSIPENEWSETEMKFNTLLNIII